MSFIRRGVRFKKQRTYKGRWHQGREPKVHYMRYLSEQRYHHRLCREPQGWEDHGEDVDDKEEVTCKLCLRKFASLGATPQ